MNNPIETSFSNKEQELAKHSIMQSYASYLQQKQIKPDIEIKLAVNRKGEISAKDIVIAQGNF